ncbi:hypothetical protein D3C72_1840640 [compost metagenome]
MDRAALAVQQASLCEDMGGGTEAADGDAAIIGFAQPGIDGLVDVLIHIDAGTDDRHFRAVFAADITPLVGKTGIGLKTDAA